MGCQKVPKSDFQSQFSMSKIIRIFLIFFSLKNTSLEEFFLLLSFFENFNFLRTKSDKLLISVLFSTVLNTRPYFFKTIFVSNIEKEWDISMKDTLQFINVQENLNDKELVLNKSKYNLTIGYWMLLIAYVIAKFFEHFDYQTQSTLKILSGHTLKHLVISIGIISLLYTYIKRKKVNTITNNVYN